MLLTVRDCCVPHDHVLRPDGRADIEDIALAVRAAEEDVDAFFARNHVTAGMRQLFESGFARLDGRSQQADFLLAQAMGGGKTHLMVAFALLAKAPAVRQRVLDGAGISFRTGFGAARIVAFSGRNNPDRFFWGEIAAQLGKDGPPFNKHWINGAKAPDEAAWLELIGDEPTVILIDELAPWFRMAAAVPIAQGTLASHGEYALATLREAVRKLPRCVLIASSLAGTYGDESRALMQTFVNVEGEAKRGAKVIEPVAVNSDEIFEILKRRLFERLATKEQIEETAQAYADAMDEAVRSKAVARTPEQYADDIRRCHPFQPSLREVVALFQNNERFRKTRGLLSLAQAIVRGIWKEERPNTVHLIGVQHMDLNDPEMRTSDLPFADLLPAITEDVANGGNAVAETVDRQLGSDAGTQAANVILAASLKPDVESRIGLPAQQVVEYLVAPHRQAAEFKGAIDRLQTGYHLHEDKREGRLYYSVNETIEKRLSREAENAPQNRVDDDLKRRLVDVFQPINKQAYQGVLALPEVETIAKALSRDRQLVAIDPDSEVPPKVARDLLMGQQHRNNFVVVHGTRSEFANLEKHVRRIFACTKVLTSMREDNPSYGEVVEKKGRTEFELLSTIEAAFDQVWYPVWSNTERKLEVRRTKLSLRHAGEIGRAQVMGEAAVEEALLQVGKLVFPDDETKLDGLVARAGDLLWEGAEGVSWTDLVQRARENGRFPFLPPGGLETVRKHAFSKDLWREREGKLLKGPFAPDRTRVSVTRDDWNADTGEATLTVQAHDAGPTPTIHWAIGAVVSEESSVLTSDRLTTKALRLSFLAVDPTKAAPTGEPTVWRNRFSIRFAERPSVDGREVEVFVSPLAASVRYTTDASSPRAAGTEYTGPFAVPTDQNVVLRVLAVDGDIEEELSTTLPRSVRVYVGEDDPPDGPRRHPDERVPTVREFIDERRPARITSKALSWTATAAAFAALDALQEAGGMAVCNRLSVGEGDRNVSVRFGSEVESGGESLKGLVAAARAASAQDDASVSLSLASARFAAGRDLVGFLEKAKPDIGDPRGCIVHGDGV